jgi:hypothetical protein
MNEILRPTIGGIRPRRDVEQLSGEDEEPECVNTEHANPNPKAAFQFVVIPGLDPGSHPFSQQAFSRGWIARRDQARQ